MKKNPLISKQKVITGPLGKKQIAKLLGVSLYILNKWLKAIADEIGQPIGLKYSIRQVESILAKYGSVVEFDNDAFGAKLNLKDATYAGMLELKAEVLERLKNHPDIRLGNYVH